jgi:hypothetical protein
MDALKTIPQLFFDAIARVVPGLTALLLYFGFFDRDWSHWRKFAEGALARKDDYPQGFVILSFLVGAYICGQFISPFAKQLEVIADNLSKRKNIADLYDGLRLHQPDAGALCAKIRAEYVMFNSLAIVFVGFAVALTLRQEPVSTGWLVSLAVSGLIMGFRGFETKTTFVRSVEQFHIAAMQVETRVGSRTQLEL